MIDTDGTRNVKTIRRFEHNTQWKNDHKIKFEEAKIIINKIRISRTQFLRVAHISLAETKFDFKTD